ncbi:MAG: helix-turn-helix domain-containing protein [Planctomycetota bacterium]|nr:helix-turn-helix domain-containing protein [Planctomycetota bacterium]
METEPVVPAKANSPCSNPAKPSALAVSLQEAADLLGVHVNTVRREIWRGNLAAVRIGRIHRVRVAEIHAYLKRNETRRPSIME